jgi:peptidoglycan/LPS O-acetylase OafA/YrhL
VQRTLVTSQIDANHSERILALDSIRGVAILMVVFAHFLPLRVDLGGAGYHVVSLGRGGVLLFFLLSGYLIFRNVERQPLPTFLSRRLFKIFPAYCVNVVLLYLIARLGASSENWTPDVFFAIFFMLQDVFHKNSMSGLYWTLLVEVKFYLLIAFHYWLFGRRGLLVTLLCVVAINLVVFEVRGYASQLLTYLPIFFVGIEIRRAEQAAWNVPSLCRLGGVGLLIALSLGLFDGFYPIWSAIYVFGEAAIFVIALRWGFFNYVLGFFGRISYSHYLCHDIGYVMLAWIPVLLWPAANLATVAAVVALITVLAYASYRAVEIPMVNFGKSLESVWRSRKPIEARG